MPIPLWLLALSILLLSLSSGSSAVAAPATLTLLATSPWNMHYADDSCMLMREFGSAKSKMFLRIEKTAPGEYFSITLIGRPLGWDDGVTTPITLTFGPGGVPDKRDRAPIGLGTIGERLPLVIVERTSLYGRPKESLLEEAARGPDAEAKYTQLLVDRKGKADFVLQLGPMDKPMAALRTCTDDLVKGWCLDPAIQGALQRRVAPTESPGTWLRPFDYPDKALVGGKSAIIRFRLVIDASGLVTSCSVPSATKNEGFEGITCDLLKKRARFEPALDGAGKPVASYYVNSVTWLMTN